MKQSKKQIKAQLVNELERRFSNRTERIKESLERWRQSYFKAEEECRKLRSAKSNLESQVEELKLKISQYEEWIERMQEFCNMPDDSRKNAFQTYIDKLRAEEERNIAVKEAFKFYNRIANMMFL